MSEKRWTPGEADLGRLWSAAVEVAGGTVLGWRTTHLDVQPKGGTTVAAHVDVEWGDGAHSTETFGATTDSRHTQAALLMSDGEREVGLWRFPHDPALPALPAACDPERMRRLVAGLGLGDGEVTLRVRAYRPCRRAVVEVRTARTSLFVKVLRPGKVEDLQRLHRAAAGSLAPESLGWTDDGLLVLGGLPGTPLRDLLLTEDSIALDPERIVEVLRTLPPALAEHPARPGWGEQARHYANAVAAVLPEAGPAAHAIADAVLPSGEPPVAVHGDFYESQLLVRDGELGGLLDIDTAGAGDRYDDPACLLGHLAVLAQVRPDRAEVIDAYAARCLREFERHFDPRILRTRVAAVVLSLATGSHRVQDENWRTALGQRLELAQRWLTGEQLLAA
ncbi:phosphotransferase family protein [Prauserella cavernicola]|uniref:Phosphotransferase n=1 Tax=Prauserella cavernicola TaxID=2800127 RepID=A0A934QSY4_9PSEU|nr:phosphotransferase [Prauserella cavernicola]MBK1784784.1 phosphotransferase [Prauserella cavernicola]